MWNFASSGEWENLVVICAGTAWDSWYPAEKHIATRMTRWAPVLYVDPPVSPLARRRPTGIGLRIVDPRTAVLTPARLPAATRPLVRGASAIVVRQAIRRAVRSLGVRRALALVMANHTDLFD